MIENFLFKNSFYSGFERMYPPVVSFTVVKQTKMKHRLILLRHGESSWNRENRFTGWTDVDLSEAGKEEARHAAALLRSFRLRFDRVFTSYLRRAIKTADIVADELDLLWTPQIKNWRLNERHYGALQGWNKKETAEKFGDEQVRIWRRSYDVRPPQLTPDDPRSPLHDNRYTGVLPDLLPLGESLSDTVRRVLPCWIADIVPCIQAGETVLIAAHGNSLRALMKHLQQISDTDIVDLEIPTGVPFVYELDSRLNPVEHYFLT